MVDFNNDATIGTPALDVVKILILQRRYDLFEAVEGYFKQKERGTDPDYATLKARLMTLFIEIRAGYLRKHKQEKTEDLYNKIQSNKEEDLMNTIFGIDIYLDELNLIKIDIRKQFDTTRMLKENKIKGLG